MILSALYPPLIQGGAEKAAWQLSEALLAQGDDVSVITLHPERDETAETLNGVRVYRLPMDSVYWPFGNEVKASAPKRLLWHLRDMWNGSLAARVGRILDLEMPDVVNTHLVIGFSPAVWREVKKREIRLVHTMHDYYLMCSRAIMFSKGKACKARCVQCKALSLTRKVTSGSVDAVISVSEYVLDAHQSRGYFPNVPGSVIYNVSTLPENESPAAADPDGEHLVFGFLGRLEGFKGVSTALEATRRLTKDNWRLRIGGTGLEAEVQALKAEFTDPRIEWLGFTNSDDYFRSIHINIIPSLWADPLPYVVIESHLHGRPIIHSDSGGIPEAAALGRKTAMFPAGDVLALAAIMNTALAHRSEWLWGGFRDSAALNMFSVQTIVDQYRVVYRAG